MKHNFLNLQIWKRGRKLVKTVYQVTELFPKHQKFSLTSQIHRSAISIPSNIAEGCGRDTDKELSRFLDFAIGSMCELETQIYLGQDLNYIPDNESQYIVKEITEIRRMTMKFKSNL